MGAIGGLLGTAGGASGTGFNVSNPTNAGQISSAYTGTQNALTQQQQFLAATQAQNGLANQTQNYNQLQGVVNGTGPNPAQAQLAQATGANTANQAALMAGQRGASQNVGLIARQAAQQGAANQQNSAGQAATLQANQSLNALSQAGTMANQQAAQQAAATGANTQANLSEQGALIGAQQGFNNNQAGLAQTTMQGQQGLIGGLMNAAGPVAGAIGKLFAGGGTVQMADGGTYGDTSTDNFDTVSQPTVAPSPQPIAQSPQAAPSVPQAAAPIQAQPGGNGQSKFAQALNSFSAGMQKQQQGAKQPSQPNYGNPGANALFQGASALGNSIANMITPKTQPQQPQVVSGGSADTTIGGSPTPMDAGASAMPNNQTMMAANGGKVPALVSPGEKYLPPSAVKKVEREGKNPMAVGETIPGKPKVGGAKNDYANDTVPKTLEEGGIVLPRSVTQAKNPHWAAHAFVQQLMAKKGRGLS
jgi:hypothetical protein